MFPPRCGRSHGDQKPPPRPWRRQVLRSLHPNYTSRLPRRQPTLHPHQSLGPLPAQPRSPDPAPLAPGRYKLQVTLGQTARDQLKQLQDLLAHQIPNGDAAVIVERALDAFLTQVLKRKAAIVEQPRAPKVAARVPRRTRPTPAAVRREVWKRDQGRCAFVGEDGHRCNETRCLEFAHLDPWGKGGEHSERNVAMRCRAHNAFEADRDYGTSFMASKRKRGLTTKPLKVKESTARYVVRSVPRGRAEREMQRTKDCRI